MPVPKHKLAKYKKYLKRQHQKLEPRELVRCQNCGEMILSHQVCPFCGYYKGRKVIEEKKKEEKR